MGFGLCGCGCGGGGGEACSCKSAVGRGAEEMKEGNKNKEPCCGGSGQEGEEKRKKSLIDFLMQSQDGMERTGVSLFYEDVID